MTLDPTLAPSTAPALWRRVFRGFRAVLGWVPLTWRGALAIPLLVWLLRSYGLGRSDKVLLVVAAGALGVIGVMLLSVLAAALLVRFRRKPPVQDPWILQAGQPFCTGYRSPTLPWFPLVTVELEWESPSGVSVSSAKGPSGRREEEVTPSERGHFVEIVRSFTVTDSWGMGRVRFRRPVAQGLSIRPSKGEVQPLELPVQYASGDALAHPEGKPEGDPVEMRAYVPGDPLKMVLWKVYARTGKMMVRLPERAISPVERTLAYLLAGSEDEPSAGIACALVEGNVLGSDFRFAADGTPGIARTVPEAVDRIIRSAGAREQGGRGLGDFLVQGESEGLSSCILFVPARIGAWIEPIEQLASKREVRFHAIVGVDGEPVPRKRGGWRRWFFSKNADPSASAEEMDEVGRRLSAVGILWGVVDRRTGRTLVHEAGDA